jgi:hypothetical protein
MRQPDGLTRPDDVDLHPGETRVREQQLGGGALQLHRVDRVRGELEPHGGEYRAPDGRIVNAVARYRRALVTVQTMTPVRLAGARSPLAAVCLVLGIALVFGSAVTLFLRENVHDRQGFAVNAVEAFQDEDVANYVGGRLTSQIVAANDGLAPLQGALERLLPTILQSNLARPIIHRAAETVHRRLFDPRGDSYVLDLGNIGNVVEDVLQASGVRAAQDVPSDLEGALVTIAHTRPVSFLVRLAERANVLAYAFPPAAVVLLALGLGLARDRRRAATWMGVGVATSGLLLWIGSRLLTSQTLSRLEGSEVQDAAQGTLDAFLGGIGGWAIVLGAVGAVIAAAAFATFSADEVNARLRTVWRLATTNPNREWLRALRAVALIALGVFVALRRDLAVTVVFAAAGFYLVLIGLSEVVRQLERLSSRAPREPGRPPGHLLPWAIAAVAIAGLVAGLVLVLVSSPGGAGAASPGAPAGERGLAPLERPDGGSRRLTPTM